MFLGIALAISDSQDDGSRYTDILRNLMLAKGEKGFKNYKFNVCRRERKRKEKHTQRKSQKSVNWELVGG